MTYCWGVCRDGIAAILRFHSKTYPDSQQPATPQVVLRLCDYLPCLLRASLFLINFVPSGNNESIGQYKALCFRDSSPVAALRPATAPAPDPATCASTAGLNSPVAALRPATTPAPDPATCASTAGLNSPVAALRPATAPAPDPATCASTAGLNSPVAALRSTLYKYKRVCLHPRDKKIK
ncbi:hypothetical protein EVAR_83175_1 [Eumeta japonica]|uniref:Uncharacterized protein n=1 Tax=Eumeta variegata TaxID=151549 RepID=A0A4C1YEA3_EUMVA|nr:hypothetical protein EVAR_83175_1 [Eumeta japonica]